MEQEAAFTLGVIAGGATMYLAMKARVWYRKVDETIESIRRDRSQ